MSALTLGGVLVTFGAGYAYAEPVVGAPAPGAPEPRATVPPAPPEARATVPASVLTKLAAHAAAFEQMKLRGEFTLAGTLEEIDGDGKPSDRKEIVLRSTPRRERDLQPKTRVIRYVDNGADKTAEARKKSDERNAKPKKKKPERDLRLPFLASEQGRYVFWLGERDTATPERVKVHFVPKEPAEDALKGSAWIDEREGEVLSLGFSFSKNPMFVDHVDVTVVFGLATPLGRAPSELTFDGRGGFLVIRKHYRGKATISEPRVAF